MRIKRKRRERSRGRAFEGKKKKKSKLNKRRKGDQRCDCPHCTLGHLCSWQKGNLANMLRSLNSILFLFFPIHLSTIVGNQFHGFWFILPLFLFAKLSRYMYVFFSIPSYTHKKAYFIYSFTICLFIYLTIYPRNHSIIS